MTKKELLARIEVLEARVKWLEERPHYDPMLTGMPHSGTPLPAGLWATSGMSENGIG